MSFLFRQRNTGNYMKVSRIYMQLCLIKFLNNKQSQSELNLYTRPKGSHNITSTCTKLSRDAIQHAFFRPRAIY